MNQYELRQFDDPALHVVCRDVTPADVLGGLIEAMEDVILKYYGVGLAAPQVGSDLRVIIVGSELSPFHDVMINPTITKASKQRFGDAEGCLSFPGVKTMVWRHKRVRIAYKDDNGCAVKHRLTGYQARIFQHELDHLDGICRVGDEWNRQRGLCPLAEPSS